MRPDPIPLDTQARILDATVVFAIDDLGGANIYPAIWSMLLAGRAEGIGGVMTMVLRNFEDRVNELVGVPVEEGWKMSARSTWCSTYSAVKSSSAQRR